MTPELADGGNAVLAPSTAASVCQATHFKIVQIIENPSRDYTLCVVPTLSPVSITRISSEPIANLYFNAFVNIHGYLEGMGYQADEENSEWSIGTKVHSGTYDDLLSAFPIQWELDPVSGGTFIMDVQSINPGNYTVTLLFDDGTTLSSPNIAAHSTDPAVTNGFYNWEFSSLSSSTVVAFNIRGTSDYIPGPVAPYFSVRFSPNASSSLSSNVHGAFNIDLPKGSERYRVTSLAAKVTFFGSDIYNQGGVAVARTYPGWSPFTDTNDPFQSIADLPYQSYNGRVSEGAHAFWVPTSMTELDWRNNAIPDQDDLSLTRLWFATKGLDPNGTFRVELDIVVEFYNASPLYMKRMNPFLSDQWGEFYHNIARARAVGDNPNHLARIGKIARTIAKGVATAGQIASLFV